MLQNNFLTGQAVLDSLYTFPYTVPEGLQKSAGMEKEAFMPILRRIAVGIPDMFTGKWFGPRGLLNVVNRVAGGGRTFRNAAGTGNIWKPTRGAFDTTKGGWVTRNWNKARNFLQDASYQGSRRLNLFEKRLDRWAKASDKAAFGGSPMIRQTVMQDGKQVVKYVPNPNYKKWKALTAQGLGNALKWGGTIAAFQAPVVGDIAEAAFDYATPVGLGITGATKGYDVLANYITDDVVVPTATQAAQGAMQSTLDAVNSMTPTQRLGFLLSPQQAQQQMQAQAEQEFARQAFAQQQQLWRQRREG